MRRFYIEKALMFIQMVVQEYLGVIAHNEKYALVGVNRL